MASNSKVFVSPGVYTSERDLSFVAQSVGVTTLGIVGETLKGPAFEPIFITNYDEFQNYFGGTSPEKFVNTQIPKYEASYIAKSYLQQSNQLFVTRILGLSGYDAGPSWSIQTIGNVDSSTIGLNQTCITTANYSAGTCDTICTPVTADISFTFSGCSNSEATIEFFGLPPEIAAIIDIPYDGTRTLGDDIRGQLTDYFINPSSTADTIGYYGTIDGADYDLLVSSGMSGETNVFGVQSFSSYYADYTSPLNTTWYNALFSGSGAGTYSGMSFYLQVWDMIQVQDPYFVTTTSTTGPVGPTTTLNPCAPPGPNVTTTSTAAPVPNNCFSGQVQGTLYFYTGMTATDYDGMVIATLRSRGITEYGTLDHGTTFEVDNLGGVSLDFSGSYGAASTNPFATFGVNVINKDGATFFFETSLASSSANYIEKVFGTSNFGKPREEFPLFVEENFSALLSYGFRKGYIKGLKSTLISLPGAVNDNGTGIGNYLEQYQTPESPWVVSEMRGNKVHRLFKFISIADGNSANTQIKISIAGVSFDNENFDVLVRDFYDTDDAPVVLEKFNNCTMDPTLNSYVAKKIGSADGDYPLNSKYIMIQLNEDAPADALPCGFEGYKFREYSGARSPFPNYKSKYDNPGDTVYTPSTGGVVISAGDNVRRTYLGFSDSIGFDSDFLQYYGKRNGNTVFPSTCDSMLSDWNYISKGFHMDSAAAVCVIPPGYVNSGSQAFVVGNARFNEEPTDQTNPYYRIYARKFTMMVSGGFDGWDIYREHRTNGDRYVLGGTGFLQGACTSSRFPNATGNGTFRAVTINGDSAHWANTDYYAYLLGQKTFENAQAYNINVFVTPGIDYVTNEQLVKRAIDMIEYDRADSLYIITTPDWEMFTPTATDMMDFVQPQEAVESLSSTDIDSNYSCTYYPWVLMRDSVNNTQIYLPPTAEVTRNLALTDNIAFPWFASAGYTRGIVNAVKARRKLTQEDRDTLYVGRINPIATFSDVGTVIWGNKTLQVRESALDRINVRRLLLQARKLISAVAVRLLFEQNDAKVRQDFLDAVNPILDAIRRDRGLYDFRVTVSSSPEDLDRNQLVGKIYIKPTKALEFIDIEFLITPTGASFENI